ncbi:hypothetical protein [Granulicella arctica]|uniref:hypothetical protein n=1 Tax=Granulicella arctica TaxID=940613 RepID=UPI0021E068AA|nr:hypothetical protein [Granulicella arctica]
MSNYDPDVAKKTDFESGGELFKLLGGENIHGMVRLMFIAVAITAGVGGGTEDGPVTQAESVADLPILVILESAPHSK